MKKITKRVFNEAQEMEQAIRINKYLSESGVCSRREADSLIEQGKVQIDGVTAVMGSKVLPGQTVTFQGKDIEREEKLVLIAFNKPQGIVCTTDRREPDNIIDFIKYGSRIYPIGRLDKDSEGLILLTNNGDIVNKILRAGNNHEKEYIVRVNQQITEKFLKGMESGVPILDTITKPCEIEVIDKTTFRIILKQGLNRQIRRMCEYFGYRVVFLQRVRVLNVNLGRLKLGGYRNLTDYELEELKELIKDSSNAPNTYEEDDEMMDSRVPERTFKGQKENKVRLLSTNNRNTKSTRKSKNFVEGKHRDDRQRENKKRENNQRDGWKRDNTLRDDRQRDNKLRDDRKSDNKLRENNLRDDRKSNTKPSGNNRRDNKQSVNNHKVNNHSDTKQREKETKFGDKHIRSDSKPNRSGTNFGEQQKNVRGKHKEDRKRFGEAKDMGEGKQYTEGKRYTEGTRLAETKQRSYGKKSGDSKRHADNHYKGETRKGRSQSKGKR